MAFGFVLLKLIVPVSMPSPLHEAALSILVQWVTSGIIAVIAFRWLRLNRTELGLRVPRLLDWPIALATLVVGMVAAGVVSSVFPAPDSAKSFVKTIISLPIDLHCGWLSPPVFAKNFCLQDSGLLVLTRFTGHRWLSGLLSLAAFTVAHAGLFGWTSSLLTPCVLGLFLTLLFLLRKNLIIGMVVHALVDTIGLILVPMASTKG